MFDPRNIHIALCCDGNVADGLVATVVSAYRSLDSRGSLTVHVIDFGLGEEIRQRAQAVADQLPRLRIEFLVSSPDTLSHFPFPPRLRHVTLVTYARLLLHDLLPALEKVIYLDCDLVVSRDLAPLWNLDLGDHPLAAALDVKIATLGHDAESLTAELPGLDRRLPYLNAGVLLLNLARLRAMDATALFTSIIAKISVRYGDQSVLNGAFAGKWKMLGPDWNRGVNLMPAYNCFRDRSNTVWHLYSRTKPWHFPREGSCGLVADYYRLLDSVGWVSTVTPHLRAKPIDLKDRIKAIRAPLQRLWGLLGSRRGDDLSA